MEAECKYCVHLAPHSDPGEYLKDASGMPPWRCPFGRFDRPTPEGRPVKCWWAWSGIWAPNDAVAKAQVNCPRFEIHPQAGEFSDTWRVMP